MERDKRRRGNWRRELLARVLRWAIRAELRRCDREQLLAIRDRVREELP